MAKSFRQRVLGLPGSWYKGQGPRKLKKMKYQKAGAGEMRSGECMGVCMQVRAGAAAASFDVVRRVGVASVRSRDETRLTAAEAEPLTSQ